MAISEEHGIEHTQIFEKSVNTEKFLEYISRLRATSPFDLIAIFMDNMTVHKTIVVKDKLIELKIEALYNVPYMPDYNPCECCFSKIKNHYKRTKLNALVNERNWDVKSLINESVNSLNKVDIINSVNFSLNLINR